MRNATITISFDEEKLSAARIYMEQKDMSVEQELIKAMEVLYGKYVPANVREYLDMKNQTARSPRKKGTVSGEQVEVETQTAL